MYPRISDLINDVFGTSLDLPIQTYGFFVATAFIVAGFLLYHELKRKEKNGTVKALEKEVWQGKPASAAELAVNALISFIVLFKAGGILTDYAAFNENPQAYLLSMSGNWFIGIGGAALYTLYVYWSGNRGKLDQPVLEKVKVHPYQLTGNIILVAAVAGLAGSKLFDVLEHLDDLFRDPVGTLFSFRGLTFFGGLIVAGFAVGYYAEKNGIRWPVIGDSVAPGLMAAYGIGRMGCQLSGDGCWGIVNNRPKPDWLSFLPDWMYPGNVINEGARMTDCYGEHCFILDQPVFPTPFYETVIALTFFVILWSVRKKIHLPGMLFSLYFIMMGMERFFIEKIRVNIRYDILGLHPTQAEIISVLLMIIGVAGLIYFRYGYRKRGGGNGSGETDQAGQ